MWRFVFLTENVVSLAKIKTTLLLQLPVNNSHIPIYLKSTCFEQLRLQTMLVISFLMYTPDSLFPFLQIFFKNVFQS